MADKLVKRHQKLAYYGVVGESATVYHRMHGFTDLAKSSNPEEYNRRYVDEEHERSDVVGYSPSFSYGFDQFEDNAVHADIAKIADEELTGDEAVREIIIVDMTQDGTAENSKKAVKREFSVIPDSEGDTTDAYTYSGTLKVYGKKVAGTATSADDWETITFTGAA